MLLWGPHPKKPFILVTLVGGDKENMVAILSRFAAIAYQTLDDQLTRLKELKTLTWWFW